MNATPAPRSGRRTQHRVTALFTAPPQAGGLGYNDLGASTGNRPTFLADRPMIIRRKSIAPGDVSVEGGRWELMP